MTSKDRPRRAHAVLIIDDEWQTRATSYEETLGGACQLEFVKSPINIERFRNQVYDALVVDLILQSDIWSSGAWEVLEKLRPIAGEFSGPVFLVTNAWERFAALSDQIARALNVAGAALRAVLPWKMFDPGISDRDEQQRMRGVTRELISLEIDRWQGMTSFTDIPGELRILHLYNLRFGAAGGDLAPMPVDRLAMAIRRSRIAPDLIVVSGNLTESGQPSEFARAEGWLASLSSDLWSKDSTSARVFVAPGGHDVNRVLAVAGEYEFDHESGGLRRSTTPDGRRHELGAFALAPFQRFATRFIGARHWGRLDSGPGVIFESRFRRFGIQIFGVSPGFDIDADDRAATEAGRLLQLMEEVTAQRNTVRLVIGEHGECLVPYLAAEAPVSRRRGPLLLFLSAEGALGSARQAIEQPAVVVPGPPSASGPRTLNVITVVPFERVTVQSYVCGNGHLTISGSPLIVALPAPDEDPASASGSRISLPPPSVRSTDAVVWPAATNTRRVLVLTVTSNERQAVLSTLQELQIPVEDSALDPTAHDFRWPLGVPQLLVSVVRVVAQRDAEVASVLSRLTALYDFEAVLMVGMAMGLPGRVQVDDVVVPSEIVSISHQRESPTGRHLVPHFYSPSRAAIARMQAVLDSRHPFSFKVHTKQHACGGFKLEDPDGETATVIAALSTDVFSYEMEAEGFFTALRDQPIEGLLIKGLADLGDVPGATVAGAAAKQSVQMRATANALSVALAFLDHLAAHPTRRTARLEPVHSTTGD